MDLVTVTRLPPPAPVPPPLDQWEGVEAYVSGMYQAGAVVDKIHDMTEPFELEVQSDAPATVRPPSRTMRAVRT